MMVSNIRLNPMPFLKDSWYYYLLVDHAESPSPYGSSQAKRGQTQGKAERDFD
jgi:hypothetical protein